MPTEHRTLLVAGTGWKAAWGQPEQCNHKTLHSCRHGLSEEARNKTQISRILAWALCIKSCCLCCQIIILHLERKYSQFKYASWSDHVVSNPLSIGLHPINTTFTSWLQNAWHKVDTYNIKCGQRKWPSFQILQYVRRSFQVMLLGRIFSMLRRKTGNIYVKWRCI